LISPATNTSHWRRLALQTQNATATKPTTHNYSRPFTSGRPGAGGRFKKQRKTPIAITSNSNFFTA
jgi:hypothetical protein